MRYGQSQIVQWVVIGSTLSYALFVSVSSALSLSLPMGSG